MSFSFSNIIQEFWIISFFCISVLAYLFFNSFKIKKTRILILLRSLFLILLLIVLSNPQIKITSNKTNNLEWNIYLDRSLSMSYHLQPSVGSYISGVNTLIDKLNKNEISSNVYGFGSELDTNWNFGNQTIKDGATNFGNIIDHIKTNNNHIAGSLIITDGQINVGQEIPSFNLENLNPIHIIGVGAKTPLIDVYINSIDAPPVIIKGNKTEIEVEVSSLGEINEKMNITLSIGNKVLGNKVFFLKGFGSKEKIRFLINPEKTGELEYKVQVNALAEEINIVNNRQIVSIQVLKNDYKIALITGAPNFNTKVLKELLHKNKNYTLDHYVFLSKSYSKNLNTFWDTRYDLVIFDNHPISENSEEWQNYLRVFAKKILSQKTSLAFFPGYDIDVKSFSSYISLMNFNLKEPVLELGDEFEWSLNQDWNNFFPFQNENILSFSDNKPPLYVDIEVDSTNSLNLASFLISDVEIPLLLLKEKKPLRSLIFSSPDFFKIYLNSNNFSKKENFQDMFNPLFSWIMKTGNGQNFYFRSNKNSYQQGELIRITGKPVSDTEVRKNGVINVFNKGQRINSRPITYNKSSKSYTGDFWASQPGNLEYQIEFLENNKSIVVSNGTIKVQESQIELNNVFLNRNPLEKLSIKTNGQFLLWKDRMTIFDKITNQYKNETFQSIFYLYKEVIFFIICVLLLASEWILRRTKGLF